MSEAIKNMISLYGDNILQFYGFNKGSFYFKTDNVNVSVEYRTNRLNVTPTMTIFELFENCKRFELSVDGDTVFGYENGNVWCEELNKNSTNSDTEFTISQLRNDLKELSQMYSKYQEKKSFSSGVIKTHLNQMNRLLEEKDLWVTFSYIMDRIGFTSFFEAINSGKPYEVHFTDSELFQLIGERSSKPFKTCTMAIESLIDIDETIEQLITRKKQMENDMDDRLKNQLAIMRNHHEKILLETEKNSL